MNSLRIAVAASGLAHVARGIEAWALDLATALAARGESVTLFKGSGTVDCPYERVVPCLGREDRLTRRILKAIPVGMRYRFGFGSGYGTEQTTFAVNLVRRLRRDRIDILHVQDPQVAAIAQLARRLRLIRTRTILAHGTEERPAFLRRIVYLQHLAPWHLDQLRAAGTWRATWTSIPNFIDTDRFAPGRAEALRAELGIPTDGLVVLTAAAIKRGHKRIDHLLAEFGRLRTARPDLPVWLVVAGGWEADTDELIAEGKRALGDRVRFLVRFPRDRMADLYRAADVFVLCSLFEMMPIAVLEATASGLPCLVNRHPVLEWMTGAGGDRLDMAAPGVLADALGRLLTDPVRREALGERARAHCVAEFSRDAVVGRILDYYRFVAADHGSGVTQ